jgi:DNA uptake protein ComE-like DNA-binding protein
MEVEMKRRVSFAGMVPVVAVALSMAACSHNKAQEKSAEQQQSGQSKQGQQAPSNAPSQQKQMEQGQASQSQQQQQLLGEQNVSTGTAQIQRQKKVVSTVIVKDKIPTVKESTIRADINRMDAKQFTAIGFPRDIAQNIVQYRDRNGPFHSVNELSNVEGVSRSMLDRFDGSLGVDQSQAGISGQNLNQGSSDQSQGQSQFGQAGQAQSDHSQTDQYQSKDSQAGQQSDSSSGWNQ